MADISKLSYALLQGLGELGVIIGSLIYKPTVKKLGIHSMMVAACLIKLLGALASLLFVKDITLGLSPVAFLGITGILNQALY